MAVCAKCSVEYGERAAFLPCPHSNLSLSPSTKERPQESLLETALTSAVIGLTIQFVTFLLGLTLQLVSSLIEGILLSGFLGVCGGTVAYSLLRGFDQAKLSSSATSTFRIE